jgi:hypothetical protein
MRSFSTTFLIILGIGLTACSRDDSSARAHEAARQAGREAYRASQEVKHGAKEAAHDLRNASREFREGWSEAKNKDKTRREK